MGINVLTPTTTALYSRGLIDEPALWERGWEPSSPGYAAPPEGWLTMGQVIESFDKLRFFHKKTMNRESRSHGAARFELDLDRPVIRSALLVYVVSSRPPPNARNSFICCNARSQISAVSRLVEPIEFGSNFNIKSTGTRTDLKTVGSLLEVGVTSDTPFSRIFDRADPPADAEAQGGTSMTGFDVTAIVRGWLANPATNLGFFLHAGEPDMTQYPYRRLFGNLGFGNIRRRKHWVRQEEFRIGSGQYRFLCLSHVAPYLIVET